MISTTTFNGRDFHKLTGNGSFPVEMTGLLSGENKKIHLLFQGTNLKEKKLYRRSSS